MSARNKRGTKTERRWVREDRKDRARELREGYALVAFMTQRTVVPNRAMRRGRA